MIIELELAYLNKCEVDIVYMVARQPSLLLGKNVGDGEISKKSSEEKRKAELQVYLLLLKLEEMLIVVAIRALGIMFVSQIIYWF